MDYQPPAPVPHVAPASEKVKRCEFVPKGIYATTPGSCVSISSDLKGITDWEATAKYCRLSQTLDGPENFAIRGGRWAKEGDYLKEGSPYVSLLGFNYWISVDHIKPCTRKQELSFIKMKLQSVAHAAWELERGLTPGGSGPVHVDGHTRCNSNRCWDVRSHWRSLP